MLVCVWLVPVASMLVQYRRGRRAILDAARAIAVVGDATIAERRHGRSDAAVGRLRDSVNRLPAGVADVWRTVDESIERYESPDGETGHFLTRGVDELLPADGVIERWYNASEFAAVPGVLTSLGLLGTFIALLLGLNGLRVDGNGGTVHGIDVLIGNLSGKFLSSIVALGLSVAFLGLEMIICQRGLRADLACLRGPRGVQGSPEVRRVDDHHRRRPARRLGSDHDPAIQRRRRHREAERRRRNLHPRQRRARPPPLRR
jgi:hypothetical protein